MLQGACIKKGKEEETNEEKSKKKKVKMSNSPALLFSLSRPKPDLTLAQSPKDRYGGKLSGSRACTWLTPPPPSRFTPASPRSPFIAPSTPTVVACASSTRSDEGLFDSLKDSKDTLSARSPDDSRDARDARDRCQVNASSTGYRGNSRPRGSNAVADGERRGKGNERRRRQERWWCRRDDIGRIVVWTLVRIVTFVREGNRTQQTAGRRALQSLSLSGKPADLFLKSPWLSLSFF